VAAVVKIMSDLEKNIKRINDKLQQLLKSYQLLQKENSRQNELIKQLQESKAKDNQQITALQEKISILKAAAGKMNEADKKTFEKNINQYIREIDKCIGILSE
jgi:chromosome segregation ATPase